MKYLIAALIPLLAQAQSSVPREITAIYSYQCVRTFLEGEGVRANSVSCPLHQRLGLIQGKVTNYLFAARSENNFHEKIKDKNYPTICELNLPQISCSESPLYPEFGLSRKAEGIFNIALLVSPSLSGPRRTYGYAAKTKTDGSCPTPLVKALIRRAKPETIDSPLPSSFVNIRGSLDDFVIKVEGEPLPHYLLQRRANETPCDGRGNCRGAKFGPPFPIQLAPYDPEPSAMAICVLPKRYLSQE